MDEQWLDCSLKWNTNSQQIDGCLQWDTNSLQHLVIQKERLIYVQLILAFAATEESQRGNDSGVLLTQFGFQCI